MDLNRLRVRSRRAARTGGVAVVLAASVTAMAGPAQAQAGWEVLPVPVPEDRQSSLVDADPIGTTSAWAVGHLSINVGRYDLPRRPLVLRWSGGRWVETAVPDVSTGYDGERSLAVAAVGARDGWLSGEDDDGVVIRRWNGSAWNRVPFDLRDDESQVPGGGPIAAAGGRVWTVVRGTFGGQDRSRVAAWTGRAWSYLPELRSGSTWVDHIDAAGPNAVWVTGHYDSNPPLLYQWTGTSWVNRLPDRTDLDLRDLHVVSARDVWVLAQPHTGGGPILLHWDGSRWSERVVPHLTSAVALTVTPERGVWIEGWAETDRRNQTHYVRLTGSGFVDVPGPVHTGKIVALINDLVTVPGRAVPLAVGSHSVGGLIYTATAERRVP